MSQQVLTANRLRDGRVVYRTVGMGWSARIEDSLIASTDAEYDALSASGQAAVASREVNDPYLIDVVKIDGRPRPTRYREIIRATGPSVPSDFRPQVQRPSAP